MGAEAVDGGGGKAPWQETRGEEQELEVSLSERKGVVVEVAKKGGGEVGRGGGCCGSAEPTHF